MKNLNDKVAVITGAGSGIGKATALELARRGCDIAAVDINKETADQTAQEIQALGRKASSHKVDVANRSQMEKLPTAVLKAHGKANIVINNAGTGVLASLDEHSLDDFEWVVGINLWGVIYGSKCFLDALKASGEGHIVNISSAAGIIPLMSMSSYCTTKFAVRGFSESIRPELEKYNIGVTVIHPGLIATNIGNEVRISNDETRKDQSKHAGLMEKYGHSPEKAARLIADGIIKNKQRVMVGWEAHMWDALKRMFPVGNDIFFSQIAKRIGPFNR